MRRAASQSVSGSVDDSYRLLAARYIGRQARALLRRLEGARLAEDVEGVHQARVASRRVRAALRMFAGVLPRRKAAGWQRQMRRLTTALGAARDTDVQVAFLREFLAGVEAKRLRPGIQRVLLRLEQRRAGLQPEVVKAIDRLSAGHVLEEMYAATATTLFRLEARPVSVKGPRVYQEAARHVGRRLKELLGLQECLADPEAVSAHHQMRIAAKRLRYTLEICRPAYDRQLDGAIKAAKEVQTLLGEVHDCDVWGEELGAFLDRERERALAYYGHTRSFSRLTGGIEHLRRDRLERRKRAFAEAVKFWGGVVEKGLWEDLERRLGAPLASPAAPGGEAGEPAPAEVAGRHARAVCGHVDPGHDMPAARLSSPKSDNVGMAPGTKETSP